MIPVTASARIAWLENMISQFPSKGESVGFSAAEIDDFILDCETVRFAILFARSARNFSKAANQFKKAVCGSKGKTSGVPTFSSVEAPLFVNAAGALKRVQRSVRRMKIHSSYSQSVGEILRIHTAKQTPLALNEAKPKGAAESLVNSIVRIDWTKGKFTGVYVESMRGDETVWTRIGFDTRSPFIDARAPLEAGKPEERRYRLLYFLNDERVGVWSDTFSTITMP
jgi:hypothetical protein